MRRTSRTGSFFIVLLINIMLNFRLTLPGWVLLILHFFFPDTIKWWYCLIYFGAFLLYMIIWQLVLRGVIRWANSAPPYPPVKNVNPYSVKSNEVNDPLSQDNGEDKGEST